MNRVLAGIALLLVLVLAGDTNRAEEHKALAAYQLGYLDSTVPSSTCAAWASANIRLHEILAEQRDDYVEGCQDARAEFHSAS